MSLICMAIHDTPENGRSEMTRRTLESLLETVDWLSHRMFICVNAATPESKKYIRNFALATNGACEILYFKGNIGTARAVNMGLAMRRPGECCVKMDNDVIIHSNEWLDMMEGAIEMDEKIGIVGLKRSDVCQRPDHPNEFYRTYPQKISKPMAGWLNVERTADVMGTCTMFSPALLDKVGYLYQPGLYGFDDVLICVRSEVAGFYNCFLPWNYVTIEHIDPGGNAYMDWKHQEARTASPEYHRLKAGYQSGDISIYYNADGTQ
jgi:GT2 family glycosyltransferase